MTDLTAISPCEGLLPLVIGDLTVTEQPFAAITSISPYKSREKDLSAALKAAHGLAFPAPGRSSAKAGARAIWFSQGQALLIGPDPDTGLGELAALTDQSDAWAVVRLEGGGAVDVLARLMPLDLRPAVFKRGHTARTELAHMLASLTKVGDKSFQIMVFRSMARSLLHDLKTAMEAVAVRG
ncbi:MAG: sarcosine oxidase subunit gamma [Rhodobacteraceae bacterium]|nr:sarcosine oxidase subunit gamma [Paracoccaceae bacterium]